MERFLDRSFITGTWAIGSIFNLIHLKHLHRLKVFKYELRILRRLLKWKNLICGFFVKLSFINIVGNIMPNGQLVLILTQALLRNRSFLKKKEILENFQECAYILYRLYFYGSIFTIPNLDSSNIFISIRVPIKTKEIGQ